jgi:hypothetical protein
VKIGKAQVRLSGIIHGRECFLVRRLTANEIPSEKGKVGSKGPSRAKGLTSRG